MKWIKKVATTPLETVAKVIDSLSGASTTNAPSIKAVNTAIDGLLSAIDAKQDKITLTASKAVVTNSSGKLTASSTAASKVGYLSNVTSDIQEQFNDLSSAISAKPTLTRLSKFNLVTAEIADSVYSTSFNFKNSDGYIDYYDGGLYTVYSSTNGIRIDSVTRVFSVTNGVTYYVLYHGTAANNQGTITCNVFLSSAFDTSVTPRT